MADTFFDFDTSLKNGEHLLPPDDDDIIENEEEYDALNDETFGALEDASTFDDWEQQHEQFAEIDEISKIQESLENSLSVFGLNDIINDETYSPKSSVWAYTPPTKNGEAYNSLSILSSLQKASKSFIESHTDVPSRQQGGISNIPPAPLLSDQPRNICTVEELEKNLIKSSNKNVQQPPGTRTAIPHPAGQMYSMMMHPPVQNDRVPHPPPGMRPMPVMPPGLRMPIGPPPHINQVHHHHHHLNQPPPHLPPGLRIPGGFMGPNSSQMRLPVPPGLMHPPPSGNSQFPPHHPYNFPYQQQQQQRGMNNSQNHKNQQQQQQQHQQYIQQQMFHRQQQQQRMRHDSGSYRHVTEPPRDEYAGLMTAREKQWLLNIQLLQLNTGTPYFDDYYFTVFKERKSKNKENFPVDRNLRYPNNRNQQRNQDRQDNNGGQTLTPRIYTPLQFENSLGKLQCGSVTAPRKIIDMDIVTPDKDSDSAQSSRDSRKTKQYLLELEALYAMLLKAEDLKNPLAISNMEKLREIKQKQRLRELELAPTQEQKQEILKIFKQESQPVVENQLEYIVKIVNGFLQEDKFTSYLSIRKGKMLLLRTLPHLTTDIFSSQLLEIWTKVLLSLPVVGRRDTSGDNILPKLYPFFKRYIQSSTITDILTIVSGLVEVTRLENSRSTPLSHQGKPPLYFVLLNKFGVSALVIMLIRSEYLISTNAVTDKQQADWSSFLVNWSDQTALVSKVATAIEPAPQQVFTKHCNRFESLTPEKAALLEKYFVDN